MICTPPGWALTTPCGEVLVLGSGGTEAEACILHSMICLVAVAVAGTIPRHHPELAMTPLDQEDLPLAIHEGHLDAVLAEDSAGLAVTSSRRASVHTRQPPVGTFVDKQ